MGACAEREKTGKVKLAKKTSYDEIKAWGAKRYEGYKESRFEIAEAVMNADKDESDTKVITYYEEDNLQLRNVLLDDYETRLKRFVYRKSKTDSKYPEASVVKL